MSPARKSSDTKRRVETRNQFCEKITNSYAALGPNTKEHISNKTVKLFKTFDLSPQIKLYVQLQSNFRKYLPQNRSKLRFVCEIYPTAF